MKKTRMLSGLFALFIILSYSGVALGGGAEIPPPLSPDCACLQSCGEPPGIKKLGPYVKGTFTVSYASKSTIDNLTVHLFLRWGNRIYVVPVFIEGLLANLCTVEDNDLTDAIRDFLVICNLKTYMFNKFGIAGTPLVKEIVITDRGGCEPESSWTGDDIIRGEITISFVNPELTCTSSQCYE